MLRLTQTRLASGHNVLDLSVCPSVNLQTCEHDILKMNEPIMMTLGTKVHGGKVMRKNDPILGSAGKGQGRTTSNNNNNNRTIYKAQ